MKAIGDRRNESQVDIGLGLIGFGGFGLFALQHNGRDSLALAVAADQLAHVESTHASTTF